VPGDECRVGGVVVQEGGVVRGCWVISDNAVVRKAEGWVRLGYFCHVYGGPIDGSQFGVMGAVKGFRAGSAGLCRDDRSMVHCR